VAPTVKADVQPAGIVALGVAHGERERVGARRDGNQVDVVRHQAVTEDAQLAISGVSGQQGQVGLAVFVVKEEIAAEVAALGDVVRAAHGHHSTNACHQNYSGATGGKFSRKRIT
jgi:hypothetical protein